MALSLRLRGELLGMKQMIEIFEQELPDVVIGSYSHTPKFYTSDRTLTGAINSFGSSSTLIFIASSLLNMLQCTHVVH